MAYTIDPLKMDFAAQKKGGMAVSAVWTLVYLLAPCPLEPRSTPTRTGGTPVPLSKNPKASGFWYYSSALGRVAGNE
ncbi:hypothetical protein EBU02_09960 [bacterium]|nr:hypothetical protein [bacterium]